MLHKDALTQLMTYQLAAIPKRYAACAVSSPFQNYFFFSE